MGVRARTAVLTAASLLAALGACEGPPEAEAALTPVQRLAADSAAADSAAFATLPPPLAAFLDVRHALAALPAETDACVTLAPRVADEQRRRVRLRFDDRSAAVLYVVAERSTGSLERVEFVRRTPDRGQRGLIWDRDDDRTMSTWWSETAWGLSRRVERGEIPRGGPVPRAMRALGRQLLLLPCAAADSAATSATDEP